MQYCQRLLFSYFENHNENEKVNWFGEIENDNSRHLRKYLRKYDDTDNETR